MIFGRWAPNIILWGAGGPFGGRAFGPFNGRLRRSLGVAELNLYDKTERTFIISLI
jgi:hypothetical protein